MELAELLALLPNLDAMSDEELQTYLDDLVAAAQDAASDNPDDETVALITQAADAADTVRAEQASRSEKTAERSARQADALARLAGTVEPEDTDTEPEPEEGDSEEEEDEETVPEPVPDESQAEAEEVAEPIAATSAPVVSRVAARRPPSTRPRTPQLPAALEDWGLVAAANAPGIQAGARIKRPEQLADLFQEAFDATRGYRGANSKMKLASRGWARPEAMYGEARTLDGNAKSNEKKIKAVVNAQTTSRQALLATGGICAPVPQTYDLPVLGEDGRPFRDRALVRFGADRGGISTIPPPVITELEDSISFWTEANDVTPSDPVTKPCLTVTCPDEDEDLVDAIVRCLRTGNFRARFFPEQLEAWMRLAATQWARQAEVRHITAVGTGSTQVTTGQLLSAFRDVLAALDRALASQQNFYRDYSTSWTWAAPKWLQDMLRTDVARQLPVGNVMETLALADATIAQAFAVRGISPVWIYDGEAGQMFGPQGDGALANWPSHVISYLYPTGSWLFLDGGSLDLGIVRDSTLNSTNDFQLFAESFEGVHFHGTTSLRLDMDLCPDGSVQAAVDADPCTIGS